MKEIARVLVGCCAILAVVMSGALMASGVSHLVLLDRLKLANTNSDKIVEMLDGCRVVYYTCDIDVSGSSPRVVEGVFNGVRVDKD